jgi:hypothetical protein
MADAEIAAMTAVVGALEKLSEEERGRVLRWAGERYGIAVHKPATRKESNETGASKEEGEEGATDREYADFAELFTAAAPKTEAERALVGGYWFQVVRGQAEIESLPINKELRNLGHPISTINRAFDSLIKRKPQWAIQLKKSGKSQQARKKYRLTTSGITQVDKMIADHSSA